ncbi:MAG TPA: TIM barrel protein [Gemmatales bacterium]|mgnify:FL=1|nr:TIM barrel protein [Gemmatales bacterium]
MQVTRRAYLVGAATLAAASIYPPAQAGYQPKGNIQQSICKWCYGRIKLDDLCKEAVKIGYKSIELLLPPEILQVKKYGLTCALIGGADIVHGLNRAENHPKIIKELKERIEFAAAEGCRGVICMSGNRTIKGVTINDEEGLEVCAQGLKEEVGLAEEKKVNIIMEGLNSKYDHKDYMYDRTEWGVKLCQKVGSPRFKLLYDIYHMQIMEGDVIRTIQKYKDYIGHYHTGGVPGRNEIDETQELYYPAIVQAIVKTGFDGYLAQEFIPKRNPLQSLAQGFQICDV